MARDSQMGIEEIGHRSSHKLKLRVHKWVKDWKKQVKQTTFTEHSPRAGSALSALNVLTPNLMGWLLSLPDRRVEGLEHWANKLGFIPQGGDLKLLGTALVFHGGALGHEEGNPKGKGPPLLKSKLKMTCSQRFDFLGF